MKTFKLLIFAFTALNFQILFAQNCDCKSSFEWVKQTFEENDAGFEYALQAKGKFSYDIHNQLIFEKIEAVKNIQECTPIIYEWLSFFRSGHISIDYKQKSNPPTSVISTSSVNVDKLKNWETLKINQKNFENDLTKKQVHDYEGIWVFGDYTVGIKKIKDEYVGFILDSKVENWTKGKVKFRLKEVDGKMKSTFYLRNFSSIEYDHVKLIGYNYLEIGNSRLARVFPEIEDDVKFKNFIKLIDSDKPYLDKLNEQTLYLRIPSFNHTQKVYIDSVLNANKALIEKTENLIIDIRNGTGGSDGSYAEIIPYLYTNPIRTIGVEFKSTKLNNQRMLNIANNPEYGLSEEDKKWYLDAYEMLEQNLNQFVNIFGDKVFVETYDQVLPFPKKVGIIINEVNGSTDEQFLLTAKQSKKVKLFGKTTFGVLDISNMHFVESPCGDFELGYSLSKSLRIPYLAIDGKGIQPDYYIDEEIPEYDWVEYTSQILNE